ncbi:RxLR effector protein [Phytophthora megakarya]|uniref:RxLR effector protein n=1 Tax=Phytophthora megakarya TaxID=4795 RepID=A0A225WKM6_9STRA|nr:RxLR effector protein [Phytophthora megakarya]
MRVISLLVFLVAVVNVCAIENAPIDDAVNPASGTASLANVYHLRGNHNEGKEERWWIPPVGAYSYALRNRVNNSPKTVTKPKEALAVLLGLGLSGAALAVVIKLLSSRKSS